MSSLFIATVKIPRGFFKLYKFPLRWIQKSKGSKEPKSLILTWTLNATTMCRRCGCDWRGHYRRSFVWQKKPHGEVQCLSAAYCLLSSVTERAAMLSAAVPCWLAAVFSVSCFRPDLMCSATFSKCTLDGFPQIASISLPIFCATGVIYIVGWQICRREENKIFLVRWE